MVGSVVNAGKDRMLNAGRMDIPQIVAPGCLDLIDFAGWQKIPEKYSDRPFHEHNRLIKSSALNNSERRGTADEVVNRLLQSKSPVHLILTNKGIEEWDREGQVAYDPEGLNAFLDQMRKSIREPIIMTELDCHINDIEFSNKVVDIFDQWIESGIIKV